jgi:hypothetical protein
VDPIATKQNKKKLPSFTELDNESFTTINNQFLISICEVRQWKIKNLGCPFEWRTLECVQNHQKK